MPSSAFYSLCLSTLFVFSSPTAWRRDTNLNSTRCPNFCARTEKSADNDTSPYICGDKRLGPVTLLAGIPLEGMAGLGSTYRRFGGLYPGHFLVKYWNRTLPWFDYPNYGGYSLDSTGRPAKFNLTLQPGDLIDRFRSENSTYTTPAGTPYAMRSLPPVNLNADADSKYLYNNY
ncbi:hemagglutination repeat-containing protein, partial [Colletotrichum asianum]